MFLKRAFYDPLFKCASKSTLFFTLFFCFIHFPSYTHVSNDFKAAETAVSYRRYRSHCPLAAGSTYFVKACLRYSGTPRSVSYTHLTLPTTSRV